MRKRMILMIVALVVVLGGIFGYKAFVSYKIDQALANRKPPAVTVSTQTVERAAWTPRIRSNGSLRAVQGVQVTSELGGTVAEIDFESGEKVAEGDLLLALDTSVERAQLEGRRADRKLAEQTLTRKQSLRERDLGSQAELDEARARYDSAKAAIASIRATIDKKRIEAPFDGTIGIRKVDLGQYMAPGTEIATLQALDPMYLDFDLPQATFERVHEGQAVSLTVDAYPDRTFEGEITAIDPLVDDGTRTYGVRATLDNPETRLRPGMFGQVTVNLAGSREVTTVPRTAITYNPYGDFIYVVTPKDDGDNGGQSESDSEGETLVVERRNVRTGETRGDQVQIRKGLEVGERIVIAGNHKLSPGARIEIDNSQVPDVEGNPANVENY